MTSLTISQPYHFGLDGNAYIGSSRVLVDTVLDLFKYGMPAEEIAKNYDTITPGEVYAVIALYLEHRDEVDEYLRHNQEKADALRQEIEAKQQVKQTEMKAKLNAARAQRDIRRAASSN